MKAIAWSIVWVSMWFAPEVHYAVYGRETERDAMWILFMLWLAATAMLIWKTVED